MRKFGKDIVKRTVCVAVAAVLGLTGLAGCSGTDTGEGETQRQEQGSEEQPRAGETGSGGSGGMGRYLEEEVTLPPDVGRIYGMVKMENGDIRIAAGTAAAASVWETKDAGGSWEKVWDIPADTIGQGSVLCLAMSPAGEVFFETAQSAGEDMTSLQFDFWRLDNEGKASEVPLDLSGTENGGTGVVNGISGMEYTSLGDLAVLDYAGKVHLIDDGTGELKKTFDSTDRVHSIVSQGADLLLQTQEDVMTVEAESGKTKETDERLKEAILANVSADAGFSGVKGIVFAQGKDGYGFFADSDGIYSWQSGGSVFDQIVNGALTSLSDPSFGLSCMAALDDDSFLLTGMDSKGIPKMLHYVYSADTPSVPETELKLYSLRDSNELRQIISKFQKDNPDILVTLEIGMSGNDAVTSSDALRTLATDILAGKGPDVLIMDGMPVDSYSEKGLLADISSIIDKINGQDGVFEQIAGAYSKDGAHYAVPTRFAIPVIQGHTGSVENINDLKSLTEAAQGAKERYHDIESVLGSMDAESMAARLMGSCSPAWVKEDGTLDEASLQEFYEALSELYALDEEYRKICEEEGRGVGMSGLDSVNDSANGVEAMGLLMKTTLLNPGLLYGLHDYSYLTSVDKTSGNTTEKMLNGQAAEVFVPLSVASISSKSGHQEEAVRLLEYILGKEGQSVSQNGGFPVNKAAFDQMLADSQNGSVQEGFTISGSGGEMLQFQIEPPTEEQKQAVKGWAESLKTPALTDSVVKEAVLEQAQKCLEEGISPAEAAKTVIQKVNLYLSE